MSLNPYIEIAQLFIPTKYSTVISITKSAVEILSTVKTKFQPEYNSIMNAKNYQTENPALYSQLFQGSLTQETIKRKSITTKSRCINEIDNFIKKYSFTNQLNMVQICKEFYQISLNCCVIDLQKILQDLPKFTYGNKSINLNEELLNSSIDELSLLLIEYTKGQFIIEEIEDEFYQNFAYLQNNIYNSIIVAIKKENKALYKQLVNQIRRFYKTEIKNQILLETCTFIRESKIPLHQMKCLIQNFFKQNQKYLQDELQNFYHFQLSNVIITRYAKKILDHQEFQIKSALSVLLKNTHHIQELSQKCFYIFLQYFKLKKLMSLTEMSDSQHVFYILLQCDDDSDEFIKLLDFILKHHNLSLTEEQRKTFTLKGCQRSYQIKEQFTKEIQQANLYWKQNVGEMFNLQILFDFYTILSGNLFVQNAFQIGHFKPQNYFLLQKLAQYFNNGLYGYLNNNVIEQFQLCMGDILQQFLRIEKKDQIKLMIQENFVADFQIISDSRDDLIQFQNKHNFVSLLIKQDKDEVDKQLKKFLREVNDEYLKKFNVPNNLSFSLATPKARFTNNITLFIPGFSESQIEGQILQTLSENYTTILVNWDYDKDNSSWGDLLKDAIKLVILKNPVEAVASGLKAYTNAPFERASKEAKIVGQHLAYLIMEKKIFGDCQINIVAYSMGAVVMYEMMKVLDKVYNTKIINDIMMLGGMVDVRKLQKRRWNCVFGNIYNIFSKKDMALKLLGMSFKMSNQLCGLNEVDLGYKGIQNINMSNWIGGQKEYGQQIKEILIQCDFQLYLRWLYE